MRKFVMAAACSLIVSNAANAQTAPDAVERTLATYQQAGNDLAAIKSEYDNLNFVEPLNLNIGPRANPFPTPGNWNALNTPVMNLSMAAVQAGMQNRLQRRLDACVSGSPISSDVLRPRVINRIGEAAWNDFVTSRAKLCNAVSVLAKLYAMEQQYQQLVTNGYQIFGVSKRQELHAANRTRTIQFQTALIFYPDNEHSLQVHSDVKWSDDNWRALDIRKTLSSLNNNSDDGLCIPIPPTDFLWMCLQVTSVSSSSASIKVKGKAHFMGDTKTASAGTYTIPAPFGYLGQVSQMKQAWMTNFKNRATEKVANALDVDTQTVATLQALAAEAGN